MILFVVIFGFWVMLLRACSWSGGKLLPWTQSSFLSLPSSQNAPFGSIEVRETLIWFD